MTKVWILRSLREQVKAHLALVLAATLVFGLLALTAGTAKLGAQTAARWRAFAGQNVHVIVYLADDVDRERALGLVEILARTSTVAHAEVVEPAEAFARLEASALGSGVTVKTLESLEPSYFPRSIEIRLTQAADLVGRATDLAGRLREVPGVVQVDAMTSGLARLSAWIDFGRRLGEGTLGAVALITLFLLLGVFLRSRRAMRQRSLVLLQLGDTAGSIRMPTCLWMVGAALLGGGAAMVALGLGWLPLLSRLERSLGIVSSLPMPRLGWVGVGLALLLVLVVGFVLGYFATPVSRAKDHA